MKEQNIQRNNRVRAAFVARGTSFHAWCTQNGIDSHNARKAVLGIWPGPKAQAIIEKIESEPGKAY